MALLLLVLLLPGLAAQAQTKKRSSSGGSGGGYSSGLTVKHFLGGKNGVALEALVTTEYAAHGVRVTLPGEKHKAVSDIKGLQFYYGACFHAGSYQGRYYFEDARFYWGRENEDYFRYYRYRCCCRYDNHVAFGADVILGLEYKLEDLPFVVGVDYKPFFEVFNGYTGFYHDAAVSLRITF